MSSYFPEVVDNGTSFSKRSELRPSRSNDPADNQFLSRGIGSRAAPRGANFMEDRLCDTSGMIFPNVRDILWDRHYLSKGIMITVPDVIPLVFFSSDCVSDLLAQACSDGAPVVSTLNLDTGGMSAEINTPCQHQGRMFTVQSSPSTAVGGAKKLAVSLPVKLEGGNGSSGGRFGAGCDALEQNLAKSLLLSPEFALKSMMRCSGSLRGASVAGDSDSAMGLRLHCELLLPNCSFQFKALKPLPLFGSPLVASLCAPPNRDVVCQASSYLDGAAYGVRSPSSPHLPSASNFGYATLNQTRKVVLLEESDGNLGCIPLVGVWVRLPDSCACSADPCSQAFLSDFQLWAACVRFVHTNAVRERVLVATGTFLLVVVHRGQVFHYECTLMDGVLSSSGPGANFGSSTQQGVQMRFSRHEFVVSLPSSGQPVSPVLGKFRRCYGTGGDDCRSLGQSDGWRAAASSSPPMEWSGLPAHDEVLEVSTLIPTPRSSLNLPVPTLFRGGSDLIGDASADPTASASCSMDDSYSDSAGDDGGSEDSGSDPIPATTTPKESMLQNTAAVAPPRDIYAPGAKALLITKDLQISALERENAVLRRMLWKQYCAGGGEGRGGQCLTSTDDAEEERRLCADICGGAGNVPADKAAVGVQEFAVGSGSGGGEGEGGSESVSSSSIESSSEEEEEEEPNSEDEVITDPCAGANIPHHTPPAECLLTEHIYTGGIVISEPSSICVPSETTVSIIHTENPLLSLHAQGVEKAEHHAGSSSSASVNSSFCGSVVSESGAVSSSSSDFIRPDAGAGADDSDTADNTPNSLRSSLVYENHNSSEEVSTELLVDDICNLYHESESVVNIELKYINLLKQSQV
mgnify:FL=1